jgi:dihydrofolate reductase
LSNDDYLNNKDIIICNSLNQLFDQLKKYNSDDIFIIGGESIYKQLLPYCKIAYVTKIKKKYKADKYFPNLDNKSDWELISASDLKLYKDTQFRFLQYINNNNINI